LSAERKLSAPKKVEQMTANLNKAAIGKAYKQQAKGIYEYFATLDDSDLTRMSEELKANG